MVSEQDNNHLKNNRSVLNLANRGSGSNSGQEINESQNKLWSSMRNKSLKNLNAVGVKRVQDLKKYNNKRMLKIKRYISAE